MLEEARLKFFADLIETELGIVYAQSNYFQLQRRLEDIATQIGVNGTGELHALAQASMPANVRELLLDVATNNETSFFRDPATFTALESWIVPSLRHARAPGRPLRVWSAAASTGQEAYSLVMTLEAMRAKDPSVPDYRIHATDVSERVLMRARAGAYTHLEIQRGLPARLLIQNFDKDPDGRSWIVRKPLRDKVEFRHLNLLSPWHGLPEFDIVFLRNVLIYQSNANKERIVQRTLGQMAPGGYLVLGASESLLGVNHGFLMENVGGVHVYRKP